MIHLFSMIWTISPFVLTRQPNFGLGNRRNLNTSNLDQLKTMMTRATTYSLWSIEVTGVSPFHLLDSNVPNINLFRIDVAQFFQPSIDCIVKVVLEQKNSAHKPISVSHSFNIVFQTNFCIFSMSCSWAGFLRATGYSPKYMEFLLPLA